MATARSTLTMLALREANHTRHVRYYRPGQAPWTMDDWMVAIGGEAGEALNLVKKINRDRQRMSGNFGISFEALRDQLGDELADVVIYLDVIADELRSGPLGSTHAYWIGDFDALRRSTRDSVSFADPDLRRLSQWGRQLLKHLGRMAEDEAQVSPQRMAQLCEWVLKDCDTIAYNAGIDLGRSVAAKFNATSEKLGFPERLALE